MSIESLRLALKLSNWLEHAHRQLHNGHNLLKSNLPIAGQLSGKYIYQPYKVYVKSD